MYAKNKIIVKYINLNNILSFNTSFNIINNIIDYYINYTMYIKKYKKIMIY